MKAVLLKIVGFTLLIISSQSFAGDDIMPVSEIKPGMRGIGKTVFAGTQIEEFEFEVLEIIPNFKPKRDLILVKLTSEKVEHSGVVAGMSGSPMYIAGKLIGALSYSMGIFMKEPIAGITPIEEMFEIFDQEKIRSEELAANQGLNDSYLPMAVGAAEISIDNFIPPYLKAANSKQVSKLSPLAIPLTFSGFETAAFDFSASIFGGSGFKLLQGGSAQLQEGEGDSAPLEPGSAYSVVLVDGDLGLQATGTVTYRDGDKILGMGHPFFNSGAVGLPMGRAKILTTLASFMASSKMAALTEIVGTVHQDRTTGVMGVSGEEPKMIPFKLTFRSEFQEPLEFNYRLAEDRSLNSLTPLISNLILINTLESARLSRSNQTLKLIGKINLKGRDPVTLENYYAGSSSRAFITDALEATGEISAALGALLSNHFEAPQIESIELNFEALPKKFLALVERIDVNKTVVKPGDEIVLTVFIRERQGELHKVRQTIKIPEEIRARRITIFAGSGSVLTQLEFRLTPQKFRPKNFDQIVELLNHKRRNNFVFFQLRLSDKGLLVEGEELPGLPPSVLSIMNSQRSTGNTLSLRDRVLLEEKIEVDFSVSGGKTIRLKVELPK